MLTHAGADAQRRAILRALAALPIAGPAAGCAWLRKDLVPICANDPAFSDRISDKLTIDAHCHVFNGSDLQVEEFVGRIVANEGGLVGAAAKAIAPFLKQLALSTAPSGDNELATLRKLASTLKECSTPIHVSNILALGDEPYRVGLRRLQGLLPNLSKPQGGTASLVATEDQATRESLASSINRLPPTLEQFKAQQQTLGFVGGAASVADGMVQFILQNLQYRYFNVYDYLLTYDKPGSRVVDMMIPAMVDYDYALAGGNRTTTSLAKQVQVMREISILTGGRVHGMAPFDPMKQVAFRRGLENVNSLALVQDAVENQGFVGVKLYPPMGFRPLGNALPDLRDAWAQDWLPTWMRYAEFGGDLDFELDQLYGWCQGKEVPILAHTSLSNGASAQFKQMAEAAGWERVLAKYPRLRISFGHFGDSQMASDGLERARGFTRLMSRDPAKSGLHAYADAGYFVEVMNKEPALVDLLGQLYMDVGHANGAPLSERFMYGTDWEMTLVEGDIRTYLSNFEKLMKAIEQLPAVQAQGFTNVGKNFFGLNAATWAGMRAGEQTRLRLETFYARTGVAKPDWAEKLDSI